MNKLSIGRIVHYFPSPKCEPLAALVVHVWSDTCCNLHVFDSGAMKEPVEGLHTSICQRTGEDDAAVWDWPARV